MEIKFSREYMFFLTPESIEHLKTLFLIDQKRPMKDEELPKFAEEWFHGMIDNDDEALHDDFAEYLEDEAEQALDQQHAETGLQVVSNEEYDE